MPEKATNQESESGDRIPSTPEEYYAALVGEGPFRPGDHGIPPGSMEMNKCFWFREELIEEGKKFVKTNFYSVMLAHCISLMWIFTFKPGRAVLLRTGNSHVENSRDRYLSTVLHIKLWYEADFIDKAAKGSQDIYGVRKQHSAAAKKFSKSEPQPMPELSPKLKKLLEAVREELSGVQETESSVQDVLVGDNPEVPVSQYSMVMTQFCFIGFLVLMPESFGIRDMKGIEGFVHNWAIFGRLLGIEDRYNLSIQYLSAKPESRTKAFRLIFDELFLPNLKNVDETAMYMWDGLLKGLGHYMNGIRLKPMIYFMIVYAADVSKPEKLRQLMNWKDKSSFKYVKYSTHSLGKSKFGREFRNKGVRFSINMAERRYLPKWKHGSCPKK